MYALRYALISFILFISFSNLKGQVFGVEYYLQYSTDSCGYVASIIIEEGSATSVAERAQFNASYNLVTPFGSVLTITNALGPFVGNFTPGQSTIAVDWTIGNFNEGPPVTPDLSYWQVQPDLGNGVSLYNNLNVGDTVQIFEFRVDPMPVCGEDVRLFENGSDPTSEDFPAGEDFNSGFTIGGPDQDYVGNVPYEGLPLPQITFDIECGADVTIVPEVIDDLTCDAQLPYSYIWDGPGGFFSTSDMPVVPSGAGSGNYCVTITDALGCDTSWCQFLVITEPEVIEETICDISTPFDLIYTIGGAGNWVFDPTSNMSGASLGGTSNGAATVTFDNTADGVYNFIYEGGEGCGGFATLTVNSGATEPGFMTNGPVCIGEITTLTADDVTGATYEWLDSSGNPVGNDREIMVTGDDVYTLIVTVGGCPSEVDVDVTDIPEPMAPTLMVTDPVCEGDDVFFTSTSVSGIADADYQWTGPNNFNTQNPTITGVTLSDAGTYTLIVVTAEGCESDPITIDLVIDALPANPAPSSNADICEGEDLMLFANTTASSYEWSFEGSFFSNDENPVINGTTTADAGTYTLIVSENGCSSDPVDIMVNINEQPDAPTLDVTSPVCVGEPVDFMSTTVTGASDADYQWTGPNNFNTQNPSIPSVSLADAGTYTVIVTINGCESDPVMVDLVVNDSSPAPVINITSPVCEGDDVEFSTDPVTDATFTWVNNASSASPIVTTDATFTIDDITSDYAGTWTLSVDVNGCISDESMTDLVINPNPSDPSPSSNATICENEDLMLFANTTASSYEWSFEGFFFSNDENPVINGATLADAGTYTLIVSENGCSSDPVDVVVNINSTPATPIANNDSPVCENEDVTLMTDAVAGALYTWTGPTGIVFNTQNPVLSGSDVIAGDYTLVIEVDGCVSEEAMTTVVINPLPAAPTVNANGPLCTGDDINLTADFVAGAIYSWTGPNGFMSNDQNPTIMGSTLADDGTYELVIELDGCESSVASVTVDIFETPEIPVIDPVNPVCEGDNVTIFASSSTAGATLTWSPGPVFGDQFEITNFSAADAITYTVFASANGCDSDEISITLELATPTVVTIDPVAPVCIDASAITLVGSPANGTFSGDGVSGDTFDPNNAGVGTHIITYDIIDGNGCFNSTTLDIEVNDLPVVTIDPVAPLCEDASSITLVGSPASGTFSGNGVSGNTFDPNVAGIGTHTVMYDFLDVNGCSNSTTIDIEVLDAPVVSIDAVAPVCIDESAITLVGNPTGGTFSGNGVSGDTFDPNNAGVGIHTITYDFADVNGCSNSTTIDIEVVDLPVVTIDPVAPLCADASAITLVGSPATGMFSGDGVSGDTFDPNAAGVGTHTIIYDFVDVNGCFNNAMIDVEVIDLPVVTIDPIAPLCADASAITLVGSPASGMFSGNGVNGDSFDPNVAGIGTHTVMYDFIDVNGCSNSTTIDIEVLDAPVVSIDAVAPVCIDESAITLVGNPTGGTFSGNGVSGDTFDPNNAGVGIHTITYDFADVNGCSNSTTIDIEVVDLPVVTIDPVAPLCADASAITLVGNPTGGTFSGNGVSGDTFDPNAAGVGTHIITYDVVDGNGCFNSAMIDIEVIDLPVVTIDPVMPLCVNASAITLVGSPEIGTFSGDGISGDTFDPNVAGIGTHTVMYDFIDVNGCSNSTTIDIVVNELPVVDAGTYNSVCEDSNPISLSGTPFGGTFTGNNVNNGSFDPQAAGQGVHEVIYTVIENGCENSSSSFIEVNPLPTVDAGVLGDLCSEDLPIELIGTPVGGTYTGPGVGANNFFDPLNAGPGTHELTFSFTDVNGCSNSTTTEITVHANPFVDAGTYNDVCESESSITLVGSPSNGSFTINGMSATVFNPSDFGEGVHTIRYEVTDTNGCSNFDETTIEVLGAPTALAISVNSPICEGETIVLESETVAGATYSWSGPNGFMSSSEDPSIPNTTLDDAGEYTLVISVDGCVSEPISTFVDINATPADPIVSQNGPICEGETLTVEVEEVAGATYEWLGPNGLVTTDRIITIDNATTIHTGAYCVAITIDGCESEFICTDVNILEQPSAPDVITSAPVCIGTDISFSTTVVADQYIWNFPNGNLFSNDQNPVLTGSDLSHNGVFTLQIEIEGCLSEIATIDVVVNDLPTVEAGSYDDLCISDASIPLVGTPENGTFTGPGIQNNIFDPASAGAGTHDITYDFTDVNGCSNSATSTIEVSADPILELVSVDCSADLLTYTVTFNSDSDVTLDGVLISGNQASGINGGDNIILVATNSAGCSVELPISAPQCDCDLVQTPISGGDQETCFNDANPSLSVTADGGLEIDWYDVPTGSTPIATGPEYQPLDVNPGVYTYYAEARKLDDNCTSLTRVPVSLEIKELPQITNANLNEELCSGESFAGFALESNLPGTVFDWTVQENGTVFSTASGTGNIPAEVLETSLDIASLTFTVVPTNNGCSGDPVDFIVTVNGLPSIDIENTNCSNDLSTYTVEFNSTFDVTMNGMAVASPLENIPSGQDITLTVTNSSTGCIDMVTVEAPQCNCDVVPVPVSGGDVTICDGDASQDLTATSNAGTTLQWYDAMIGGTNVDMGPSYNPGDLPVGTTSFFVEAVDDVSGCTSDRIEILYTVNALPEGTIVSNECTADLSSYEVTINTTADVSSSAGTLNGNVLTVDINTGSVTITLTDAVTGCTDEIMVTAPTCNCDDIAEPISGGDQAICVGESTPALSVTVGAGLEARWYDAGNAQVSNQLTYTSTETAVGQYVYFVEAINPIDGCTSDRIEVRFTINALPEGTIVSNECTADLSSYEVTINTTADVSSSAGTLNGNVLTVNINTGNVTITLTDAVTGCTDEIMVTAPMCNCDDIAEPISGGDQAICIGESNPSLSVTVEAGLEARWYDAGNTEVSNQLTYTSTETAVGQYVYFVDAINPIDGCTSDRIEVRFTINALPEGTIVSNECTADLSSYEVTINTTADVSSSAGTLNGNVLTVDITTGSVTITLTDAVTGCTDEITVTAPTCNCDDIAEPISGGDQAICIGESTPTLSVTVEAGLEARWYDAGNNQVSDQLTYTSLETAVGQYVYFVEAINPIDGCTSDRIEVRFTINALPEGTIVSNECTADLSSYEVTINTTADVSSSAGTLNGNVLTVDINTGSVTITLTDALTGCTDEIMVTAPTCNCDVIAEPISGGDQEICFGESNPSLNVTVEAGLEARWYDAGNSQVSDQLTYTSIETAVGEYVYFVEAIDPVDGCTSDRIEVRFTINALPEGTIVSNECTADFSNYEVTINTTADVSSSAGTLNGNVLTVDINTGSVTITLTDPTTGCTDDIVVTAPNCNCPTVAAPINGGDATICFGESAPELSVTVEAGLEARWYDAGNTLVSDQLTYEPAVTAVGEYIFTVEAIDPIDGCSSDRTEVRFTINALPEITNAVRTQQICIGESTQGFVLESDIEGTTFTWSATSVTVTDFATNGNGDIPVENLDDNTMSGVITYTVTPTFEGCVGNPLTFEVNILLGPSAGEDVTIACFLDGVSLDALGNGEWTILSTTFDNVSLEDINDPKSDLLGFEGSGTVTLEWTVNGCSDEVMVTIGSECECDISENNINDVPPAFCMTTNDLTINGDEAQPVGGEYLWEVSVNGGDFVPASGINNQQDYDAFDLPGGEYIFRRMYSLGGTDTQCSLVSNETPFLVFTEDSQPGDVMFTPDPVCQGDTMFLFIDNFNPALTYDWTVTRGSARFILELDSMSYLIVDNPGVITVTVTQSLEGCGSGLQSRSTSQDINIFASPIPQLGEDQTFCELDDDNAFLLIPGEFEEYEWQDGSDDPVFEVDEEGIYSVTVIDSMGCEGTDFVDIKSFCCEFYWPNIINSGNRGANSMFEIHDGFGCALTSELTVFDRWGNLIFRGEDINTWDGTFNGQPVEQGVYVFLYNYTGIDADRQEFEGQLKGDITVIRDR